jgi:radical SAM protein with 4Fe4S-binding SPASM domain
MAVNSIKNNFESPGCAVWELTLGCNLKCLHCGSSAGKARSNELNTKESLKLCKDLAELGTSEVCLMGGEPLIRRDWHIIGKEIKDLGMRLSIISNGILVNENIISKLAKLEPHAVSTSLDGGTAKTHDLIRGFSGSFDRVMNYLSLARKADLPTSVITTANKLNYKELPMIKDLILNRFIAWQIQSTSPIGRFSKKYVLSEEEFYSIGLFIAHLKQKYSSRELPVIGAHCFGYNSKFIPSLGIFSDWIGCQAGISIISIQSNGGIKGCLSTPDEYIEDNVRKRSIIDVWKDPNAFSYNRKFKKENLGKFCKDCNYGETCKGGCMSVSTSCTGKPNNDPYCFYRIEQQLLK